MESAFPRSALFITAGLLIWAADFLFIYVFAALACARGYADASVLGFGIVPFASAISSIAAFAASGAVALAAQRYRRRNARDHDQFRRGLAFIVAVLSLIAVAMTAVPGMLIKGTCA